MTQMAKAPVNITPEDVVDFLKQNQDFFQDNPKVLEQMNLPAEDHGAGVVDFQSVLVNRLKADKTSAQILQRDLIDTVRANMTNQNRIHTAILVILEADSFEELVTVITQDLPTLLDVDTVNVIIESTSKEVPFVNLVGMRFAVQGTVNKWLGEGDALLQDNIKGHEDMFGPGAGLVNSHALLRLEISKNTPSGIIAFGSRDPNAFNNEQGIDQIGFLAQVIERTFRIWLDVHE